MRRLEEVIYEIVFTQTSNPRTENHTTSLEAGKLKGQISLLI